MRHTKLTFYTSILALVFLLLSIPPKKMHKFRAALTAHIFSSKAQKKLSREETLKARIKFLEEENSSLKQRLSNPEDQKGFNLAKVIFRDPAFWSSSVLIDKGYKDSQFPIERNSPVISNGYLIGLVEEVFDTYSKVRLITDKHLQFSVKKAASDSHEDLELGTLCGISSIDNRYKFKNVEGIFFSKNLNVGDLLVTSGYDGIFPEGLPVAKVTSVKIDQEEVSFPFKAVVAAPDIKSLRYVSVLKPLTSGL